MLFPPECQKRIREPALVRPELVDDGVAPRANRDEPLDFVHARPPMVDRTLVPRPAALAPVAVPREHLVADAGEIEPGVPAPGVAGVAKPGNRRATAALGTKQPFLVATHHVDIIAFDKTDYH